MPDNVYHPVKRQEKLSVQIAEQIQNLIINRELKPGERLPAERDLCEQFKVSRTVVREAISILEAKGLLSSQGGSGTYVRAMKGEDVSSSIGMYISTQSHAVSMMDLLEVRRVLESQVVKLAAERATPEAIERLEVILNSMCSLVEDPEAFARKDLEYHVALAQATQNELFGILLEPLTDAMLQLIYVGLKLPGTAIEACDYHRRILDKVKAKDVTGAAEEMMSHLAQTGRVTRQGLEKIQRETQSEGGGGERV